MSTPSTGLVVSKNRANLTPFKTTPTKNAAPFTESPGNWQHPRIKEITHRQNRSVFTSDNMKTAIYNVAALIMISFSQKIVDDFGPRSLHAPVAKWYIGWIFAALYVLPLWNIGVACLPLVRGPDEMSDIPLTPAQRKLLGLPPSSKPATPDAAYSTPPRYTRTPSIAGSTGKMSPSTSPLSASAGSPTPGSRTNGSPYSPVASPLLHKAVGYSPRRSSSQGSQNTLNTSTLNASTGSWNASTTSFNSSVFSEPPATPSPPGGKRISVGLNNKWLYERSRRNSGNVWS